MHTLKVTLFQLYPELAVMSRACEGHNVILKGCHYCIIYTAFREKNIFILCRTSNSNVHALFAKYRSMNNAQYVVHCTVYGTAKQDFRYMYDKISRSYIRAAKT